MATLTVQPIIEAGTAQSYATADSGGDVAPNDGTVFLHAKNAHGSATRTITITPQTTSFNDSVYGTLTKSAVAITVAAGGSKFIGPFKPDSYNNSSGQIVITYSDSAANITIAALSFDKNKTA